MSDPKEPHLLLGPDPWGRAGGYDSLFPGGTHIRGESSTGYSVYPHNPEAPANIARVAPAARIVYVVRDPIERTIAHYAQATMVGRESRSIELAVDPGDDANYFVTASRYWRQLERFLEHFRREAILVIDSDSLRGQRERTLARVFEHVGADPGFSSEQFDREYNKRGVDNVRTPPLARRLRRTPLASIYRSLLPVRTRHVLSPRLSRYLGGREVRPEPGPDLLERLAELLEPEADHLREFTGEAYEGWSV